MSKYNEQERINAFWSKVDKSGGENACWPWTAALNSKSYGNVGWHYKILLAHRVVWELINGSIPNDLCVCHSCDNPACCNPAHLWLGTHADNMHDMYSKNRRCAASGEKHWKHKLTWNQINMIRMLYSQHKNNKKLFTQETLALLFRTSHSNIHYIVTNKYWVHE